ncbi:hypothetical protein [uncultured Porphyromonas sp.]|uniref:hypothetical protein n=1 Tax=uncultured Porphyromonas sp. TaxID=159274 RepID=UPI0026129F2D|nr:hypothetical protein [uncultured Porphyromonas sp.]
MDYVTILRKGSFTDFFKYGRLKIFHAVPMSGKLEAHADDKELFDHTAEGMNPYDYTSEYILIVFHTDDAIEQFPIEICIESVETVYALDETGRNALSLSFDHRIDIRVSPWETFFEEHHIDQLVEQSKRGARNLWRIFDFDDKDLGHCEKIISTDIIREAISSLYRSKKPVGDLSPWVYLLRYERHDPYPKNMLGYFYDMIGVVMTWKYQGRVDNNFGVSETVAGGILKSTWETISHPYSRVKNDQLSTLASRIKDEKIAAAAKDTTGVDFHLIAPFFLCLKDLYASDEDRKDQEKMGKQISSYGLEGKVATYLLGVTLGYDRTYDLLYDKIKLPFFKENNTSRERSGSATDIKPEQRVQRQSLGLEDDREEAKYWFRNIKSHEIEKMAPGTVDKGWKPVQKFTKENKTDIIIRRKLNFEEERHKQQEWNKRR